MLNDSQKEKLLRLAREKISSHFNYEDYIVDEKIKEEFSENKGAFVTLSIESELRGCIGFIEAIFPLWEAVVKAAEAAAFSDPRFSPLTKEEFASIHIEISILSSPELMSGDYLEQIEIGRDGLVIEMDGFKGLLLPQVPVEWKWEKEEFLENTCVKAGLAKNAWREPNCKVFKFSGEVFGEKL